MSEEECVGHVVSHGMAEEGVVHLVNHGMNWRLRETDQGTLTDGSASEELQRDRIHQIVQWLQYFPERLPEMEALTRDGQAALDRARAKDRKDRGACW
jgi:hypothetical protein